MGYSLLRALVVAVFFSLVACGPNTKNNDQGTTFLLPWAVKATEELSVQPVHIRTLRDPSKVEGPAAKVYIEAGLTAEGINGEVARPRYIKSGSHYVPRDVKSGQALAIYAHYEKIQEIDRKLGIDHLLSWPRQVTLGSSSFSATNNAMYLYGLDVTVVLYFKQNTFGAHVAEKPLSLNRSILGHEHFHALFAHAFRDAMRIAYKARGHSEKVFKAERSEKYNDPFTDMDTETNNYFTMKAFDEGLADFFGYVYSGDPAEMSKSLSHLEYRRLDQHGDKLWTQEQWKEAMNEPFGLEFDLACKRRCRMYAQGVRYARNLYKISTQEKNVVNAREELAKRIIRALPKVAERFVLEDINSREITAQQMQAWLYEEIRTKVVSP